jgi:hypothetical protein
MEKQLRKKGKFAWHWSTWKRLYFWMGTRYVLLLRKTELYELILISENEIHHSNVIHFQ